MEHFNNIPRLWEFSLKFRKSKEAVYDYSSKIRYTYGDLDRRSDILASFLIHELGLKKRDRIAFCSVNHMAFLDAYYMSCKTGIIITSYNCLLSLEEIDKLFQKEMPHIVFYSRNSHHSIEKLKELYPDKQFVSIDGEAGPDEHYSYEDILDFNIPCTYDCDFESEDPLMLIHTGGTTGTPKAAVLTRRSLYYNHVSSIISFGLSNVDSTLVVLPLFHTAALNVLTMPVLMAGGRIILTASFNEKDCLDLINQERPSVMIAVETIYTILAKSPSFFETDFSCFRWMISGASPIALKTLECYWDRGIKLINSYGMTEIGPNNLSWPVDSVTVDDLRSKPQSVGMPLLFNSLRVIDDEGRDVSANQPGELIWQGRLTFGGYWQDEESTKELIKDGWIYSGDIAYFDPDGYFYICGRSKNIYISGGENIFPVEIENIIFSHPCVDSVCVIGVPDEKWGEVGKALIVLKEGRSVSAEAVKDYLHEHLGSIKIPKYVQFVDMIPKNSVGKLDTRKIRKLYGSPGVK